MKTLDKYERFSLNHHLAEYPKNKSYVSILRDIKNPLSEEVYVPNIPYDGEFTDNNDLVETIRDFTRELRKTFKNLT